MDDEVDFSKPWAHSDIRFEVEHSVVHANKTILSMWSPVMHAMFEQDFKEKGQHQIKLPGKCYAHFLELMQAVHPPNKEIEGKYHK